MLILLAGNKLLKVKGFACNPEQAIGLLTGGAGTLFDL